MATKLTKKFMTEKIGFAWNDDMTNVEKIRWEGKALNFACNQSKEKITFSGSEKQIAWAQSIFKEKLFEALMQEIKIELPAIIRAFERIANEHSDAAWWIDHRSCRPFEIIGKDTLNVIRSDAENVEDQDFETVWNYMITSWEA